MTNERRHTPDCGCRELLEPRRQPRQVPLAAQARMVTLELLALRGQRLEDVPAAKAVACSFSRVANPIYSCPDSTDAPLVAFVQNCLPTSDAPE